MKIATKAALLSGLIYPGFGHLFLKHYRLGCLIIIASLYPLYILVSYVINKAVTISEQLINGEIAPDFMTIRALINQNESSLEASHLNIATIALVLLWLISLLDSYRLGRKQDKQQKN